MSLVALESADQGGWVLVLNVDLFAAAEQFAEHVRDLIDDQFDGDVHEE